MTTMLCQRNKETFEQTRLDRGLFLDNGLSERPHNGALMIAPVRGAGDAVAVALIPPQLSRYASHNGVPLPAGMTVLRHADRIDFKSHTLWVSVAADAKHIKYTPHEHGQDVFCFITKARLKQGEPITICPGRPEQPCGMIYKRVAWEMALEASTFKCPNCQFDPHQPPWEPPREKPSMMLDALFRILSQEPAHNE